MTYDSWKTTDVAMERASDAEDALDKYEAQVWDELVEQYETQHGEEVPRDIMDDYRDQMFDWMNDDLSPKDAAEIILESRAATDILVEALERSDKRSELTIAYEQAQVALSNASADMTRALSELEGLDRKVTR